MLIKPNGKFTKPKAGLLLFASPRFSALGSDTCRGTYSARKENEVGSMIKRLEEFLDISFPGVIYEREQVRSAVLKFLYDEVDFIVTAFLSWTEDFAWIRFLREIPEIPVLFINPVIDKYGFTNTKNEDDFIDFLCAGGLVGSLEASGSLKRFNCKKFKIVMGSWDELYEQIRIFSKAAKARSVIRSSNFGLLANYNELMWSTYIDPYNFFARVGPELKFISYSTLAEEINAVSDEEAEFYVKELLAKYQIMEDVEYEKLLESARASLGMANIAKKMEIDALIFNDLDPAMFKLVGLRPGFYHDWFNENLSIVVPEADVGAGFITYLLKLFSKKHVNFIEPFYIEKETGIFAAGHAGPNDHNDPTFSGNVKIARDVRFAKTSYKYAGAPFAWYRIPPGRKTMAHFSEYNGQYKLVCTLVDSLEGEHFLASYSHSVFKPIVPVTELFERILNIGTTQHFAVVDGDYRNELKYFAYIMGFDYYSIE